MYVPPLCAKLPAMVKFEEGAVNTPADRVKLPFTSSVALGVAKVSPVSVEAMVKW